MPIFKKQNTNIYLESNFKVMYSSLLQQESLEDVEFSKRLYLKMMFSKLNIGGFRIYLLVRNPYARAESFFKNKFRSATDKISTTGEWQKTQEIFFPYLGLDSTSSAQHVAEKLSSFTFEEFISVLPKVHDKNPHLHPQCWLMVKRKKLTSFFEIAVDMSYQNIFKLESKDDLEKMAAIFEIDIDKRANSTEKINVETQWSRKSRQTFNSIYERDFQLFNYEMI